MKTIIVTQARYGSSRLPGKILKKINNKTMLDIHLDRLKLCKHADEILVATTTEVEAINIINIARAHEVGFFQGSTDDVLDRFYQGLKSYNPKFVIRVTSDCPLNDGRLIDQIFESFISSEVDYMSNALIPSFADGLDVEIFKFSCLKMAWEKASEKIEREHVTPYIYNPLHGFKLSNFKNKVDDSGLRMTLDYEEDFVLLRHLIQTLGEDKPWEEYVELIKKNPNLQINRIRNETFNKN